MTVAGAAAQGVHEVHAVRGTPSRMTPGGVRTPERVKIPDLDALPLPDRAAIDHRGTSTCGAAITAPAASPHHGPRLPLQVHLVLTRGVRLHAPAAQSRRGRRRSRGDRRALPARAAWYADDVFTISHPWLHSYAGELRQRGLHLPFETITRADRLQNEAAAQALAELGCYRVWIGSESGSQQCWMPCSAT